VSRILESPREFRGSQQHNDQDLIVQFVTRRETGTGCYRHSRLSADEVGTSKELIGVFPDDFVLGASVFSPKTVLFGLYYCAEKLQFEALN
jgi:hypothetical protein